MILDNVLFLAAYTSRSQAYAQAMRHAGLYPSHVVLFGAEGSGQPGQMREGFNAVEIGELFVPDFSEPLIDTVKKYEGSSIISLPASNIKDPTLYEEIARFHPRLVIYSGYGGQIVGKDILNIGAPFLHMHSGWLPNYRGSTTIYYSILKEGWCGVSAILLSSEIDTGVIVKRRKYPQPQFGLDIDHVYDGAMRADLLLSTLKEWSQHGEFRDVVKQTLEEGIEYYVIHPVLKHLAILSLKP